jgi:hypothetical protein
MTEGMWLQVEKRTTSTIWEHQAMITGRGEQAHDDDEHDGEGGELERPSLLSAVTGRCIFAEPMECSELRRCARALLRVIVAAADGR